MEIWLLEILTLFIITIENIGYKRIVIRSTVTICTASNLLTLISNKNDGILIWYKVLKNKQTNLNVPESSLNIV